MNFTNCFVGQDSIFAKRLQDLMKKNKTTQKELADAIRTTRQAVAQYIDGSVQPNIEKLYKIASYYGCDSDYLLGMSNVYSMKVNVERLCDMSNAINGLDGKLNYEAISTRQEFLDIYGYIYDAFYDIRDSGLNVCNTFLRDMKELIVLIRNVCYNADAMVAGIDLDLFNNIDDPLKLVAEFKVSVQEDKKKAEQVLESLADRIIRQSSDAIETHISHLMGEESLQHFIDEVKRIRGTNKLDGNDDAASE